MTQVVVVAGPVRMAVLGVLYQLLFNMSRIIWISIIRKLCWCMQVFLFSRCHKSVEPEILVLPGGITPVNSYFSSYIRYYSLWPRNYCLTISSSRLPLKSDFFISIHPRLSSVLSLTHQTFIGHTGLGGAGYDDPSHILTRHSFLAPLRFDLLRSSRPRLSSASPLARPSQLTIWALEVWRTPTPRRWMGSFPFFQLGLCMLWGVKTSMLLSPLV